MVDVSKRVTLNVSPSTALVDERVSVCLTGLAPAETATIGAEMVDDANVRWRSHATYIADASGSIDVAEQTPIAGSYTGVEPMGLFWSMVSETTPEGASFVLRILDPKPITISASVGEVVVATCVLKRLYVSPGVTRSPVRSQGLVGTFFLPEGKGPFPGVIVVGGSGGGLSEGRAAILASRGLASLALAYFHYEGLPDALKDIPLEYFQTALHWMAAQPRVAGDHLAVTGGSRGGELVLILGATFPEVKAVIGYVPSGLVNGSIGASESGAGWTHRGKPAPYLRSRTEVSWETLLARYPDQPIPGSPMFLSQLDDTEAVAAASIPVENIRGPVLLISGTDDRMWPSSLYSEMVVQRLKEKGFKYPVKHVACEGAGHMIAYPYEPTTVTHIKHPVTGDDLACGGTPRANARAAEQSWAELLAFLRANL